MKWLFFSYSVPAKPSKPRVHAWRQLKKLGAVNYKSLWVVPHSKERVQELLKLIQDIESFKGEGFILEGKALSPADEEAIKAAVLSANNEEYQEVLHKCEDFLKEIAMEIERKNFIFAEVEENEEEFEKLKKWLKKVEKRTILETPLRKEVIETIKRCEQALDEFSQLVYEYIQENDVNNA
jgi:hypothetical protein